MDELVKARKLLQMTHPKLIFNGQKLEKSWEMSYSWWTNSWAPVDSVNIRWIAIAVLYFDHTKRWSLHQCWKTPKIQQAFPAPNLHMLHATLTGWCCRCLVSCFEQHSNVNCTMSWCLGQTLRPADRLMYVSQGRQLFWAIKLVQTNAIWWVSKPRFTILIFPASSQYEILRRSSNWLIIESKHRMKCWKTH